MNGTEKLSYGSLFVLAITLLLKDQLIMAIIAIVPLVATSFKYGFPQKKPSGHNH